ncbi:hypothetical protein DXG03_004664 [Asterophora parasitica]|uniref:Uncharacterized protein n=1 Tax=Asterophora parasitica TaxID=117018 RepID=A0A9P7G2G1_9AGAR|nr:hypothetical protein DXG03_004664 [Asterophora parasitica]
MVKRAKSPDTDEDEKYFTIYQPYPLNANWELEDDYIAFSRWIATIIGTDPIHAFHYKPSARGMVLIEVDKKYPYNERLLGEHKWSEILNKPTNEEKGRVSQVFHSFYNTGRAAQKDGWKRIHVEARWFKNWVPTTNFKFPYPATEWCPTPPEDKTNKPLCRPLPTKVKAPPPKAPQPVVGSANWVTAKTEPSPNSAQVLKGAWANGRKASGSAVNPMAVPKSPQSTTATSPTSAWNKPILYSLPALSPTAAPSVSGPKSTTAATLPTSAWNKPILKSNSPATQSPGTSPPSSANACIDFSIHFSSASGVNTSTGQRPAAASPISPTANPPLFPPGLDIRVPVGQSLPIPPGLTKPQISNASYLSTSSGSSSDSSTQKALDELFDEKVMISLSPSQDRQLYGLDADQSPEIGVDVIHPWEAIQNIPTINSMEWSASDSGNGGSTNLWADVTGEAKKAPVALCPHHQNTCKKGVCTWRAKKVKEEERLAALAKKIDAGGKGSKGGSKGKSGANNGGWRQNTSTPSETNEDDDGFSQVTGGRNRGRRMGSGRGRENRGRDDASSAAGSYDSGQG